MISENDPVYNIPQLPQTQVSLNEQLEILHVAATRLGLYDAADWIWNYIKPVPPTESCYGWGCLTPGCLYCFGD